MERIREEITPEQWEEMRKAAIKLRKALRGLGKAIGLARHDLNSLSLAIQQLPAAIEEED